MKKSVTGLLMVGLAVTGTANALTLTSSAFTAGSAIPSVYTCQGKNISPPLAWTDVPAKTEAFAIVVRDPDSPSKNWVHWIMYNLPLDAVAIPENYEAKMAGALVGKNSWNKTTYEGPCPTSGAHHYRFELYALDQALYVDPGLTADQLGQAMSGHILGMGSLTGTYGKTGMLKS